MTLYQTDFAFLPVYQPHRLCAGMRMSRSNHAASTHWRKSMTQTVYTLIIAASLATLLPASQGLAQGGPDVTVINPAINPAKTSSVDDPGRTPYQFFKGILCNAASCQTGSLPPVPVGKRLVLQHWSITGGLIGTIPLIQAFVVSSTGQQLSNVTTPVFSSVPPNGWAFGFDQAMQGYVDAGNSVTVLLSTNTSGLISSPTFTVTGYLLDCTVNQCAAIAP
jgi:hypothetical protein